VPGNAAATPMSAAASTSAPAAAPGPVSLAIAKKLEEMRRGNGLTAAQVATRAVSNSKQLAAKRSEILAADSAIDKANAGYMPSLRLAARYTRLSDIDPVGFALPGAGMVAFPVVLNQFALTATLDVPLSDYLLRVSNGTDAAKHSREAAVLNERALQLSVARDARVAYYEWIRAQGSLFVGDQGVEQARGHLTDAEHAFAAGVISRADVMRAKSGLKAAELFRQRTQSAVRITTDRLRVMMGDPATTQYEVGENILQAPAASAIDETAAVNEAQSKRLELRSLDATTSALRSQTDLARAANYPRLDAQGSAQYSNPNERYFIPDSKFHATWAASLVLSWTPTDLLGTSATTSELTAKTQALESQRADLHDALRLEVSNALSSQETAAFALGASQEQLLASEEGFRARGDLFRAGRSTSVEVTDAETDLTRARLEVVNAYVDLHIAAVQLEHVLGRDQAR
jgi:outer membrane protein TolC